MSATLTILDVGHGNCSMIEHAGKVAVIDAGGGGALVTYLAERQITRIDTLLISHADEDHINGLLALLGRVRAGQVSIGIVRINPDAPRQTQIWEDVIYELDQLHRRDRHLDWRVGINATAPGEYDVGGVGIEVVAPSLARAARGVSGRGRDGRVISANSLSVVVRLHFNGRAVALLPGDLDEHGLDDIEASSDLQAAMLVYPHHGGRSSGSPAVFARRLMARVRPQLVVFSIGRERHHNPRPEVVEAIRRVVQNVWIACTQLSRHCATEAMMRPRHLNVHYARGRDAGHCCAGSIVIQLGGNASTSPSGLVADPGRELHARFVNELGTGVLCRRALPPVS
jgi:beta-lactamase superfamily II metal-dependent hydrolase